MPCRMPVPKRISAAPAEAATALFCRTYMLQAAFSLGVLRAQGGVALALGKCGQGVTMVPREGTFCCACGNRSGKKRDAWTPGDLMGTAAQKMRARQL